MSTSTDGGKTFAPPAVIAKLPSDSHIVNGAWIAVDPALGEEVPDALHIKIVQGDISPDNDFLFVAAILGIAGRLEVDILDVEWEKK